MSYGGEMPNSFLVEIVLVAVLIISWYISKYFGFSTTMYFGLVFMLIFMVFQKL